MAKANHDKNKALMDNTDYEREFVKPKTHSQYLEASIRDERRVINVLRLLSACAIVMLILIGSKAYAVGHTAHGITLYMFSVLMMFNHLHLLRKQNNNAFKQSFFFLVAILFLYLTATGGESNTGPLWFYVFPSLAFYIFGLRIGLAGVVLCMLAVLIMFRFPNLPFVTTSYTTDFQIRFLATLSFVSLFAFVLDSSRRTAQDELMEMVALYDRAARTDELTELSNRRDMKSHLENEFSRYQRHGHHFSVILMDIDHFKQINDNYGHDAGDIVLKDFSRLLKSLCRRVDVLSRWGGEEFLMLLPDTSLLQALSMAERLRDEVELHRFTYRGAAIPVTMSAGVCSISQFKDIAGLLKQTDVNLYEAKVNGRNRIVPAVKPTRSVPLQTVS